MKRTFWKQNLFIGVLMGLVMVLGMQEVCEALTLTPTSPIVQSKRAGSTFEMTFSVGLTGNRVQNHPTYTSRRINADLDQTTDTPEYIDSQGYVVNYIEPTNRSYRVLSTQPTRGTLFVAPLTRLSGDSGAVAGPIATGSLLADSSSAGNLIDAAGKPVYTQDGAGTADDPWTYVRATVTNTDAVLQGPRDESARFNFNDEAIGITFPAAGTFGADATVKLKTPSFTFGSIATPDLTAGYTTGGQSLRERVRVGLPSSITLVCEGAIAGTHEIVIWDATYNSDFPRDGIPDARQPRQSITFTLHVTPATTTLATGADIEPDIQRIPVEDAVEPVSEHLDFTPDPGNNRIRYEVVRGSGTLYVGTLETQHTTPASTILVHQASDVYLNTNETSNEVHIFFAGEDRSAPRATIVFEYKGKDLPARNTGDTGDTGRTVITRTPSLSIDISGNWHDAIGNRYSYQRTGKQLFQV